MWQSIGMLLLQVKLGLLTNLHLLLELVVMLPLMEAIGSLLKFAQRRDVSTYDFIATMKANFIGCILTTLHLLVMNYGH
jgi:hypothetical protein